MQRNWRIGEVYDKHAVAGVYGVVGPANKLVMKVWATMLWLESSTRDYSASGDRPGRRISPPNKFGFSSKHSLDFPRNNKGIFVVKIFQIEVEMHHNGGFWAVICWVWGWEWPRVGSQPERNMVMPHQWSHQWGHHTLQTSYHTDKWKKFWMTKNMCHHWIMGCTSLSIELVWCN